MPEIKGFRGWRYNPERVRNLADVFAPPYDVISKKEQDMLYQKNPHNIIRLELGKEEPGDSSGDNKYTRAADTWKHWTQEGVLTQDSTPTLYVHAQDYKEEGKNKTRVGFLAAMKIDEKMVRKHENTLSGPKKDRLELLKAARTNLSPIFGLFEDMKGSVHSMLKRAIKQKPVIDVTLDGVRHRLFLESDPEIVGRICANLKSKPMYLADGHHRFEVSKQFKEWMEEQTNGHDGDWQYVMTYFCDFRHNPFKIFPTHRLVNIPKGKSLLQILEDRGAIKKAGNGFKSIAALKKYQFGFYSKKEGFFVLTLSPKIASRIKKCPVDRLDVAVLHEWIIKPCFKITAIEKSADIDFTRDANEARVRVDRGDFDLAIFLRPTSLDEIILASKKGLKMPQKSTYFYPKLLTGLVFHHLEDQSREHPRECGDQAVQVGPRLKHSGTTEGRE